MARTYNGFPVSQAFEFGNAIHVSNIEATIKALEGVDYRTLFGADANLDRIKITQWSPDTCGCVVDFIWSLDDPENDRKHHFHRTHRCCGTHKAIADKGKQLHHAEVFAENTFKNVAVGFAADQVNGESDDEREKRRVAEEQSGQRDATKIGAADVGWSFDDQRQLVLSHPRLTDAHLRAIQRHPLLKGRAIRKA